VRTNFGRSAKSCEELLKVLIGVKADPLWLELFKLWQNWDNALVGVEVTLTRERYTLRQFENMFTAMSL